jgi:hypothetical protein
LKLYENSLFLTFLVLFFAAFVLRAVGGVREYNHQQVLHGGAAISTLQYIGTAQFWFESFQNWQSEFLAAWVASPSVSWWESRISVLMFCSIDCSARGQATSLLRPWPAPGDALAGQSGYLRRGHAA